jgi:membrane fusion protein (multidrug efflux system)
MSEQNNDSTTATDVSPEKRRRLAFLSWIPHDLVALLVLLATVSLVILFANDWKLWDGARPLEETNDAYVRSDVTPLSTKVAGTVSAVYIDDYDTVRKGQLLVELRNDDFTAKEKRAKSNYDLAMANIDTIRAQIQEQQAKIENARLTVDVSRQQVTRSAAAIGATKATIQAAGDTVSATKHEKMQAEAKLRADEAVELRAYQEKKRQEALFLDQASTQQTIEQVTADYDKAKEDVAADRADIERLSALIGARSAQVTRQKEELNSASAEDTQSVLDVSARNSLLTAENMQLNVLQQRLYEAQAQSQAVMQAWNEAKVELDYTKIRAPVDGTLSERRVRAGQEVNAGTQVVTIVSSVPWVIASYRETQTRKIQVGDRAEVSVDALGGAKLKGSVQSLSPASEAQFALLPPDNPSGNFTKITQRVPIKIVFEKDQKLLGRIKPGMTVIAKIWTR